MGNVVVRVVTREGRASTGEQETGEVVHLEDDESFAVDAPEEEYPDPEGDTEQVEVSDEVFAELTEVD